MISSQLYKERGRWIRLAPWTYLGDNHPSLVIDVINGTLQDLVQSTSYDITKVIYCQLTRAYHLYFKHTAADEHEKRIVAIPSKSSRKQIAWEASVPGCIDLIVNQHRVIDYTILLDV